MKNLARAIRESQAPAGGLAIFWLGQAGFVFKTASGMVIYIDPYLSDVVERQHGFKRIMTSPIAPEDVEADLVISTHEHEDHLDTDAIPVIARNPRTHFAGPARCVEFYRRVGLAPDRYIEMKEGGEYTFNGVQLIAVFADHGELAPDSLGVVIDFGGLRIYHTGDSAFRPEKMQTIAALKPDIVLPCINGVFGNMDPDDAARLVSLASARLAIPAHFWMFAEHNGNPARFLGACRELAPGAEIRLMTQGEEFTYTKS